MHVSQAAGELLQELRRDSGITSDAGVRVEPAVGTPGALGLAFRTDPEPDDQIVDESGVRVFVPQAIANELNDRTLDVVATEQGAALTLK